MEDRIVPVTEELPTVPPLVPDASAAGSNEEELEMNAGGVSAMMLPSQTYRAPHGYHADEAKRFYVTNDSLESLYARKGGRCPFHRSCKQKRAKYPCLHELVQHLRKYHGKKGKFSAEELEQLPKVDVVMRKKGFWVSKEHANFCGIKREHRLLKKHSAVLTYERCKDCKSPDSPLPPAFVPIETSECIDVPDDLQFEGILPPPGFEHWLLKKDEPKKSPIPSRAPNAAPIEMENPPISHKPSLKRFSVNFGDEVEVIDDLDGQALDEIAVRNILDDKLVVKSGMVYSTYMGALAYQRLRNRVPSEMNALDVSLVRDDLQELENKAWLGLNVMQVFMKHINSASPHVQCFDPILFNLLRRESRLKEKTNYLVSNLRRHTKRLGRYFDTHDALLVPIVDEEHWHLIIIDLKGGKIDYYDPLHNFSRADKHRKLVTFFVSDDFRRRAA